MKIVSYKNTETKFLVIDDVDTLVMMVMLKKIPVYWLTPDYTNPNNVQGGVLVENPQTIYGGCPNLFGIKLPKEK